MLIQNFMRNKMAFIIFLLGIFVGSLSTNGYGQRIGVQVNIDYEGIVIKDDFSLDIWDKITEYWKPNDKRRFGNPSLSGNSIDFYFDQRNLYKPFRLTYKFEPGYSDTPEPEIAYAYGVLLPKSLRVRLNPDDNSPFGVMILKTNKRGIKEPIGEPYIVLASTGNDLIFSYDKKLKTFFLDGLKGRDKRNGGVFGRIQFEIFTGGKPHKQSLAILLSEPGIQVFEIPKIQLSTKKKVKRASSKSNQTNGRKTKSLSQSKIKENRLVFSVIDEKNRPLRRLKLQVYGNSGKVKFVETDDKGNFGIYRSRFPGSKQIELALIGNHKDWFDMPADPIPLPKGNATIPPIKVRYVQQNIVIELTDDDGNPIENKSHAKPSVYRRLKNGKRSQLEDTEDGGGQWIFYTKGAKEDVIVIEITADPNRYAAHHRIDPMFLSQAAYINRKKVHRFSLRSLIEKTSLNVRFFTRINGRKVSKKITKKKVKASFTGTEGEHATKNLSWHKNRKRYVATIEHHRQSKVQINVKSFRNFSPTSVQANSEEKFQTIELNLAKPLLLVAWNPNLRLIKKKLKKKGVLRHTTALTNFVQIVNELGKRRRWSYLHVVEINEDEKPREILSDTHGGAIKWNEKFTDNLTARLRQKVSDRTSVPANKIIKMFGDFVNGFSYGPKATRAHLIYILEEPTKGITRDDLKHIEKLLTKHRMTATILQFGHNTDGEELKLLTGAKSKFQRLHFVKADITKSFYNDYFFSAFDKAAKLVDEQSKRRLKQKKSKLVAQPSKLKKNKPVAQPSKLKKNKPVAPPLRKKPGTSPSKQPSKITVNPKAVTEKAKKAPGTAKTRRMRTDGFAVIRATPSLVGIPLAELEPGKIVTEIGEAADGQWLKIKWKGKDAYLRNRNLTEIQDTAIPSIKRRVSATFLPDVQFGPFIKDFSHVHFTTPNGSPARRLLKNIGNNKFITSIEHKPNTDVKIDIGKPYKFYSEKIKTGTTRGDINFEGIPLNYRKTGLYIYIDLKFKLSNNRVFSGDQKQKLRYSVARFVCRVHKAKDGDLWSNIYIFGADNSRFWPNDLAHSITWKENYIDKWVRDIPVKSSKNLLKTEFILRQFGATMTSEDVKNPNMFVSIIGGKARGPIDKDLLDRIDHKLEKFNLDGLVIKLSGQQTTGIIEQTSETPVILTRKLGQYRRLEFILADAQKALRVDKLNEVFDRALLMLAEQLNIGGTIGSYSGCPKLPQANRAASQAVINTHTTFVTLDGGDWYAYAKQPSRIYWSSNLNDTANRNTIKGREYKILTQSTDKKWLKIKIIIKKLGEYPGYIRSRFYDIRKLKPKLLGDVKEVRGGN